MKFINDLKNIQGVTVLLRLDLNVPIQNGIVLDDYRIRKSLPTLNFLINGGARVIIISHIEGENPTLSPVAAHLNKQGINCKFEKKYKNVLNLNDQVILLENIREYKEEKENDPKFAKELASLADIYVNDAFSVSHRKHASVCAVTKFLPSYAGIQMQAEIKNLSLAFNPQHPFLFMLGGAKFSTKLPLIDKFVDSADKIFIGGALANDFFVAQGKDIGNSLVSEDRINFDKYIRNEKIMLPSDSILKGSSIMDAGMKTVDDLSKEIFKSKFILWNGPFGAYEQGYKASTLQVAEILAEATRKGATTIVGGGDTLATITELGLEESFSFVSTGGGAMLDFLANGTLPGIQALDIKDSE